MRSAQSRPVIPERDATDCLTVTPAAPETEPAVAVIVALPFAAAVTSPEASTRATSVSLDDQENSEPGTP